MSSTAPAMIRTTASVTPWRRHLLALAVASAAILILFARDAAHMAVIWWTSSTFNHCLIVLPIIGWLAWQRIPALATLTPSTWSSGLFLIGTGAVGWLLGDAAGVSLFRHFGLVVMLQGAVATLLGRDVARALLFPLFYALFLIPAGEELVPVLQGVTAHISMALLALVGIPAHIEGIFITTPGGYFEVAEACSGVKFLIAMLALGVLVAALGFRTWPRRIAFVAAALVVPILANGVRAFATIYVAGQTSTATAAGFDHIVYGWFFFGIIIAALMGAAWRFFDRGAHDPFVLSAPSASLAGPALPLMLALSLTLVTAPLLWSKGALASARSRTLPPLAAPQIAGWSKVARGTGVPWQPAFAGADRFIVQRYRNAGGAEIDLAIAIYAWQAEGRELVGYGQGAATGEWSWSQVAAPPARGRADRIVSDGTTREVLSFYRVGDLTTGNDAEVKLATLKARLLGGQQTGVAILMSSVPSSAANRIPLDDFAGRLGPIDAFADRAAGR